MLVKLYHRSDFNEVDENDLIKFSYGSRKIALRKKPDGTCLFLSEKRRCTAYEARPVSCRIFPIDVILDEDNNVTELELSDVIRDRFIKCKFYYGKARSYKSFEQLAIQAAEETDSYWKKIRRWNRMDGTGGKSAFLRYLGVDSS